MTENEIKEAFHRVIAPRGAGKKLGLDKSTMYEIRKRGLYSDNMGKQLEVLWRAGLIQFKDGSTHKEGNDKQ